MKLFFLLPMAFVGTVAAGLLDSLSIRFGGGIAKPYMEQRVESSVPGTDYSREIPAMFGILADLEATLRRGPWEAGLAMGIDGEVVAIQRLESTGFSVAHTSLLAAARLLRYRNSELWLQASGGLAIPTMAHDEAGHADALPGWRIGSGLAFARGGVRAVVGGTLSETGYRTRGRLITTTSRWTEEQWVGKVQWDWIAPD